MHAILACALNGKHTIFACLLYSHAHYTWNTHFTRMHTILACALYGVDTILGLHTILVCTLMCTMLVCALNSIQYGAFHSRNPIIIQLHNTERAEGQDPFDEDAGNEYVVFQKDKYSEETKVLKNEESSK